MTTENSPCWSQDDGDFEGQSEEEMSGDEEPEDGEDLNDTDGEDESEEEDKVVHVLCDCCKTCAAAVALTRL